ncbi:MAG: hypothetical protein GY699_03625 [Desulfobacteraceae bacterium]|nr:hypothetical protein [Desulfobacteraceae bacterium]
MKKILFLFFSITIIMNSGIANADLSVKGATDTGYQLIYDSDQNITWLDFTYQNHWNAIDLSAFSIEFDGQTIGNWRLPEIIDTTGNNVDFYNNSDASGFGKTNSEFGYLYHTHLGHTTGEGLESSKITPFENLNNSNEVWFWYGTYYAYSDPRSTYNDTVWAFDTSSGGQFAGQIASKSLKYLLVHDGDVSAVPIPSSIWIIVSGLLGLLGIRRRVNK